MAQTECGTCGRSWPNDSAGALQGGCPYCLLAFALGDDDEPMPAEEPATDAVRRLGPYTILETLGQGGMGVVYKGRHEGLGRVVALKVLNAGGAQRSEFPLRFQREGQVLACLAHEHIVAIHDLGCEDGQFYLAMEYVDGPTLRQYLAKGPLPWRRAVEIVSQVAAALEHAHAHGIVHRDVKPENILIDAAGAVRLGDFGIAKLLSDDAPSDARLTQTQVILGTRSYMAPEQLEPGRTIDHRADVYSLGVVFYEMLTGELPLGVFPPPSRTPGVDPRLDPVVRQCLDKDPARRFQRAQDLIHALQRLQAARPRRRWLGAAAALLLATPIVGFLLLRESSEPLPPTTPTPATPVIADRIFKGHAGRVWSVNLLRNGDRLATASEDRTLRLWNTADGRVLATLPAFPRGDIGPVVLTTAADEQAIATAGGEGIIRLWDLAQQRETHSWPGHTREITALRFAPAGSVLASGSHDRSVKLWDATSRKLLHILTGHTDPVLCLAFSADGKQVAAGAMNGGVRVWDAATGAQVSTAGHPRRVWAVAFAPDTGWLATGSHEGNIKLWDLSLSGPQRNRATIDVGSEVWSLAYSPDARVLAAGCQDGVVRFWDAHTRQPLGERRGHEAAVVALSFSADGARIASGSWDQAARLWDVPSSAP